MITFTAEQLHSLSPELLAQIILDQQRQLELQTEQISRLNDQMERLIEQIRIANANRFGRKTERLSSPTPSTPSTISSRSLRISSKRLRPRLTTAEAS